MTERFVPGISDWYPFAVINTKQPHSAFRSSETSFANFPPLASRRPSASKVLIDTSIIVGARHSCILIFSSCQPRMKKTLKSLLTNFHFAKTDNQLMIRNFGIESAEYLISKTLKMPSRTWRKNCPAYLQKHGRMPTSSLENCTIVSIRSVAVQVVLCIVDFDFGAVCRP